MRTIFTEQARTLVHGLASVLTEELELLQGLQETLQHEREALIFFNTATLTELATRKRKQLVQLESLEAARAEVLTKIGPTIGFPGKPTIDIVISRIDDASVVAQIRHLLSCLKSIAQAVHELNMSQRDFVACSLAGVENALLLLDNLQRQSLGACYDQQGGNQVAEGPKQSMLMDQRI